MVAQLVCLSRKSNYQGIPTDESFSDFVNKSLLILECVLLNKKFKIWLQFYKW